MNHYLRKALIVFFSIIFLGGCNTKEEIIEKEEKPTTIETKSYSPESFDWEEIGSFMPTPPTQIIHTPWCIGPGDLGAFYEPDIVNDYKKADGWRLVYSSFKTTGPQLINPYFVLYNVYRGTLRIYRYLNNITYSSSSYITETIGLNGNISSSILNFLSSEIVDPNNNITVFNAVQPKPVVGGPVLVNEQWYMIEYELAYDPTLASVNARDLWFEQKMDSYNITEIELGGSAKTEISGSIGAASSASSGGVWEKMWGLIKKEKSNAVNGVAGIVGKNMLNKLKKPVTEDDKHNNTLGINNEAFTGILTGFTSMASTFYGGIPKLAGSLLNGLLGGNSGGSTSYSVSLKASTSINLTGKATDAGSVGFLGMIIPGTKIGGLEAQLPLYNAPLGVINYIGDNTINITEEVSSNNDGLGNDGFNRPRRPKPDAFYPDRNIHVRVSYSKNGNNYTNRLVFNPEVERIATISVLSEDLIVQWAGTTKVNEFEYDLPYDPVFVPKDYSVRFYIQVKPKDGSPASYIIKTFKLNPRITKIDM